METRFDYRYEAYDTLLVRQIRVPQQEWIHGAPLLGATGKPLAPSSGTLVRYQYGQRDDCKG